MSRIAGASRFLAKHTASMFERNTQRSINNLYSGVGLSRKGKATAILGMAAYGGYKMHEGKGEVRRKQVMANMDPRGIIALPSTQSDGVGYRGDPGGSPDFGANGDLVFALHNLRHGG